MIRAGVMTNPISEPNYLVTHPEFLKAAAMAFASMVMMSVADTNLPTSFLKVVREGTMGE